MSQHLYNALSNATLHGLADLELVLVRHGQQVPLNARKTMADRKDPPLSALGERQVEAVGAHLAGEDIDAVYASPLRRAHDTGLAIAKHHSFDVTVVDELREVELRRGIPDGGTLTDGFDEETIEKSAAIFSQTGLWKDFPFAEPGHDLRLRVLTAIDKILSIHESGRVVIACHSGVISGYLAEVLGIEKDYWFRTAHCSVNRLFVRGEERRVWNLNETQHLVGDLFTA